MGYSVREPHSEFVKKYRAIAFKYHEDVSLTAESCRRIATVASLKQCHVGPEKVK